MAPHTTIDSAPPPSLITPPPDLRLLHKRQYTPSADKIAQVTTWKGREGGAWDLPYFPIWDETRTCENKCLWGGAETVDNWLLCQNDKNCVCKPPKLSSAVVWASKCAQVRCGGDSNTVGAAYAQTVVLEFCKNAWRESGEGWAGTEAAGFVVPRTGTFVDSISVATVPGQNAPGTTASASSTQTKGSNQEDGEKEGSNNGGGSGSSSKDSNIGLKAGLGGGIGALALILIAIGLYFGIKHCKKRRARRVSMPPAPVEAGGSPWVQVQPPQDPRKRAVSITPGSKPVELPVGHGWGENPSDKPHEQDKPRYDA
ncbi:hypothetical protein DFH27DRAFT_53208 [Peziza echinospora]|nr:hypothetical protein DFH27DRAFT_53208 [Peziza echinospora]